MNLAELQSVLADMEAELAGAQRQVETLKSGVAALRLLVAQKGGLQQASAPEVGREGSEPRRVERDPDAPQGRDSVRRVLDERPGEWMDLDTLNNELISRGWGPRSDRPREATRANAHRLVKEEPDQYEGGRSRYRRRALEDGADIDDVEWDAAHSPAVMERAS